jgi:hypothetical protein
LPGAIATLQQAIAADKARPPETASGQPSSEEDDDPPVSLAQRATPFIEMLERAVKAGEPVIWGYDPAMASTGKRERTLPLPLQ